MGIDDHPNVFHFEGRYWVSDLPRDEMKAQFTAQRAWDSAHVKSERWALSIAVGAVVGCAATIGLGTLVGLAPAVYLVLLPLGFAVGAVLGAVINKRLLAAAGKQPATAPRPVLDEVTRVPASVARKVDALTLVADVIDWSKRGFIPKP